MRTLRQLTHSTYHTLEIIECLHAPHLNFLIAPRRDTSLTCLYEAVLQVPPNRHGDMFDLLFWTERLLGSVFARALCHFQRRAKMFSKLKLSVGTLQ